MQTDSIDEKCRSIRGKPNESQTRRLTSDIIGYDD